MRQPETPETAAPLRTDAEMTCAIQMLGSGPADLTELEGHGKGSSIQGLQGQAQRTAAPKKPGKAAGTAKRKKEVPLEVAKLQARPGRPGKSLTV